MTTTSGLPHPPKLAVRLVSLVLDASIREPYLGDLEEAFLRLANDRGEAAARRWYWREALRAPLARRRGGPVPVSVDRHSGASPFASLGSDVRLAFRGLVRQPGFAAVFILTTSLGIGAATAIFSAARPILFAPVPYPNGDRLVRVKQALGTTVEPRIGFTTVADLRDRNTTLGAIALIGSWQAIVQASGEATMYKGLRVSPEYFGILGVRPFLGRDFRAEDDVPNTARTAIISYRVWQEQYGSDSTVINRTVRINDFPYTIIGVMPAGFEDVLEPEAEFWRPLFYTRTTDSSCRSCQHLRAIARIKPGVTLTSANADVASILTALGRQFPSEYPRGVTGVADPLAHELTAGIRPAMIAAFAAVILVLLIACVNATNLLLGRAVARRAELAVRTALGAQRSRLVRQLVVESGVLSIFGGVVGVAMATAGLGALRAMAPASLPRLAGMHVNVPVLLVSLGVTMIVGIGFGLIPALAATRGGASHDIRLASRRSVGATGRTRSALVVAEMALAVIVLVSSGLLLRSMRKLLDVSPGFDPHGVVALQLVPVGQRFNSKTALWQYYEQIAVAARQIPGVQFASFTSQLPLSDDFDQSGVHSQRHPRPNPSDDPSAHRYGVTPGYLEAMRIPIVRGRSILAADDGASRDSIALVNEQFAAKNFPGEDPIGQRIRIGDPRNGVWRMIVGVTGNIRQVSLAGGVADAVYVPERQQAFADGPIWLVVRTTRSLPEVAAQVRSVVRRVDPTQPIVRLASMERIIASSASGRRFVLTLFEVFAALSAVLGGLGMYGVLSASVTERIREIGVRGALGATATDITRMIVGRAVGLAAIGAVIGLVATRFTTALISDQLFQTAPTDTATLVGVLVGLGAIAVAASSLPAARAARVDPMESLRAE